MSDRLCYDELVIFISNVLMSFLQQLFSVLSLQAEVFHNGQYCGQWAIDTSGHDYINFHVVTHGQCYLTIPEQLDTPLQLNTGDIVLFPRDSQHCLSNEMNQHLRNNLNQVESISFTEQLVDDGAGLTCGYFSHQNPFVRQVVSYLPDYIVIKHDDKKKQDLHYLIQALLIESTSPEKGSALILSRMAEVILAILLRDYIEAEQGIIAANLHPKLSKSLQAFHLNPEKKWTVELLAEASFMSRAAYNDLFKQVVKMTPIEYVTQWRFAKAYQMLSKQNVTIIEAALACGYDNESSFSKAFKRTLGVSPSSIQA